MSDDHPPVAPQPSTPPAGQDLTPGASTRTPIDSLLDTRLAALDRANIELREKVLSLREKDLLELREAVSGLRSTFKIALSVGAVVVTLAAGFGIKQYSDLDKTLNDALRTKIDRSLGYYDQFAKAVTLTNANAFAAALPILAELHAEREEDELVFSNYVNCFAETERFDEGYEVYRKVQEKGLIPKKFKFVQSYNNPGYVALIKSFSDSTYGPTALSLLSRAESIATAENSPDLKYPLWNLSLYYLSTGDLKRAAAYAKRFRELDAAADWWRDQGDREWFKRLQKKRPDAKSQLGRLYPPPSKPK